MRPVGVILMIIGVLLGGTGGYALAQYIRSDDWVLGRSAVVNAPGERVVISQYGATSFDTDIRLTATSQTEAVFVGTANPIDVADYTADVASATITSMTPLRGIDHTSRAGSSRVPVAAPLDLDFWIAHTYGTGPQSLVLSTADVPSQVVVIAPADGAITLRVDYHVTGIRPIVFGVIGTGGGLVLIGLALLLVGIVRRRRRPRPAPAPVPAQAPPVAPPSWPPAPLSRWASALLALTMVSATSGCSLPKLPAHVNVAAQAEITKVPLTLEKSAAVADDLTRRMNTARTQGNAPTFSPDAWKVAYTELALDANVFDTTWKQASGTTESASTCGVVIDEVYGSLATAYPMTTTVVAKWFCGSAATIKVFSVLTRAHSYSPWLIAAEASLVEALPPKSGRGLSRGTSIRQGPQQPPTS